MTFSRVTGDPEELSILTTALDNYCLAHDIVDEAVREGVARWIVLLFDGGARTAAELREALGRLHAATGRPPSEFPVGPQP